MGVCLSENWKNCVGDAAYENVCKGMQKGYGEAVRVWKSRKKYAKIWKSMETMRRDE